MDACLSLCSVIPKELLICGNLLSTLSENLDPALRPCSPAQSGEKTLIWGEAEDLEGRGGCQS